MKLVTVSDTRYASCFSSWSFFLSSSSSTLSLFLPLSDVYVFVSSIIFHFSRSCPSLAASFATLSSLHATLPSLLTDYRDSSLPSFFHSIALFSAALPLPSLNPFPFLFSFIPLSLSTYSLLLSSTYSVLFVRFFCLLSLNHSPHTVFFPFSHVAIYLVFFSLLLSLLFSLFL